MKKYQDQALPAFERARALLNEMTLNEKVGQLNQRLYGFRIYERKQTADGETIELSAEFKEEVKKYSGLGTLYGLYRADPWADKDYSTGLSGVLAKKAYNEVQKFVLEHSRLGIPALMSTECPHGHQALDGYLLPVNLAAGATFHPALLRESSYVCGTQLQKMGVDLALVSMLDVLRDPRWGRSEECYSEDPYLCARMAEAAVTGIQEAGPAVVAKHFAAQGEGTGGINASAARIGERELREIHLPPMAACAKAGVKAVMAAYNEIDGIYCHANPKLLRDILREEMGFSGIVMSDGVAIDQLDGMTGDNVISGALALKAGVDMGLWDTAFGRLEEAVNRGLIHEAQIDEAVLRILTLKFERGLFEHPFLTEDAEGTYLSAKDYPQSLQMARESVILLQNKEDLLPLTAAGKGSPRLAVIGPNADALYNQLGDYTPPVRAGEGTTVLAGVRQVFKDWQISFSRGCYLRGGDGQMIEEALHTAKDSDVILCVLGGSSSRFDSGAVFDSNGAALTGEAAKAAGGQGAEQDAAAGRQPCPVGPTMDCGEGMDCADLELPTQQLALLEALAATGKPVITVIISGRPLVLTRICRLSGAVLQAFYPGPAGGQAIAEILAGRVNPSGRLPVSLPEVTGQVPVYYNYKSSYQALRYMDCGQKPLFSFGFGLDYTSYAYEVTPPAERISLIQLEKEGLSIAVRVKNTGSRAGFAVPQLYVTDPAASVVRRVKELKAFDKVYLEAGQEKEILLTLTKEDLSLWDQNMKFTAEPGRFLLELSDQGTSHWKGEFELCI